MYHGIMNVYKEKGMTSFDVVAALRRICGQKKIGHTGTLDPEAEGVLPVCLGKATKVCDLLTDRDKEYVTLLRLGIETDTQDLTGAVISMQETGDLTPDDVRLVIGSFQGAQEQIPPMYSAKKVNGKRLYELARAGITVERKAQQVTVHEIEILKMSLPDVTLRIACSKGTYIRTICHDIGQRLGCGGVMVSLLRTRSAGYRLADAVRLREIARMAEEGRLSDVICPVEQVFSDLPRGICRPAYQKALENGSKLPADAFLFDTESMPESAFRACCPDGEFAGLYAYSQEESIYRAKKMFIDRSSAS